MRLILFIVVLSLTGWLSAQSGQPRVRYFPPSEYGGQNQNWDLAQGSDGRIFVANASGVLTYDGSRWEKHPLPGGPVVRSLHYSGGRLYAGGYEQFGYFDSTDFRYRNLSDRLTQGQRGEEIWNIVRPADGPVVFQSFARFYVLTEDSLTVTYPPAVVLFAVADGAELVVPATGRGLLRWRPGGEFRPIPGSEVLGDREVKGIVRQDSSWLVATGTGLLELGGQSHRDGLPLQVNRLLRLRDGTLAVGTINDGLYLFGPEGGAPVHLMRENGLGNNTVLSLLEDRAGDLWVGLDRGLALVVRHLPLRFSGATTAELGAVYTAIHHEGTTYLGTNQGLYRSPGGTDPAFELVPGTKGQVWELYATGRGDLLCGHNDGTFLVEDDRATLLSDRRGGWQFSTLDPENDRLLQATYTGLNLVRYEGGIPKVIPLDGPLMPLRSMARAPDGSIVAAHGAQGVYRLLVDENAKSYRITDTLGGGPMTKALLSKIGEDLLIHSDTSTYQYVAGKLERLFRYQDVPLPPGAICLAGREHSTDWFLVENDRVTLYRGERAMIAIPLALNPDYPTVIPWGSKDYLLCLDDGYAVLSDQNVPAGSVSLEVTVSDLRGATHHLPDRTALELPFSRNDLRFRATLPVFDRPVRFRHRLLGMEQEWSAWDERPDWIYNHLPEGSYRMEVEADWFDARQQLDVVIRPPWYRTVWAYGLYFVVTAIIGVLLYRLHRRGLANQARRLEVLRVRQLQRQEIEARNQQLEEDIGRKNKELANTTLALARKNEMLLEIRKQADRGRTDKLLHLIDRNLDHEADWALFEDHFNAVHDAFLRRLREAHPELTTGELQLAAYLKMNLTSKEIAPLLHISLRGVENKRYRLRKKLDLEGTDNLNEYLMDF